MIVNRYVECVPEINKDTPWFLAPFYLAAPVIKKLCGPRRFESFSKGLQNLSLKSSVKKATEEYIAFFYKQETPPLFSSIEIETINRCNGTCPFCPVNRNDDSRKFKIMEEELFYSIIDQLGQLNYSGRLALHSNNEPFLDKRIIKLTQYAKERVPQATVYMYTNGTMLTMDKFLEIMKYLDRIVIDNYDDQLRLSENSRAIHEYCRKHRGMDRKVEIHLRKQNEVLNTRGGQSPNNQKKKTYHMSCCLPFKQVVVRPDGKVSLCCNDPLGKFTMGDLNRQTLTEVWNSARYASLRRALRKGRKQVSLCRYCDTMPGPGGY